MEEDRNHGSGSKQPSLPASPREAARVVPEAETSSAERVVDSVMRKAYPVSGIVVGTKAALCLAVKKAHYLLVSAGCRDIV